MMYVHIITGKFILAVFGSSKVYDKTDRKVLFGRKIDNTVVFHMGLICFFFRSEATSVCMDFIHLH